MSIAHCFVRHFQRCHPRELGAPEVEAFLAMLANEELRVSACAHNQALSALLFLYRAGLEQELPWLDNV
ncbi:MAG: site-specific integrase [Betaproteobacteria bacterium]